MAELVHQNTEEMLNELEQLQRTKLFSPAEIKAVIKKRTRHEYKLVRRKKHKKDFIAYVQYEVDLLNLIGQRRSKLQYYFKKDEIEYVISRRIHRIFKQATSYWSSDLKLWISHANFCLKWNKRTQLSKICTRLLQIHGDKPDLWILTAKWEIEVCKSMDNGRLILMRAIKRHPDFKKLWIEFFRAELMFAEKLRKRLKFLTSTDDSISRIDETENKLMNGGAALIVYRNAIARFPGDSEFHVKFISVISCFLSCSPFAQTIIDYIENDLISSYSHTPLVRSVLAQLHLYVDYKKVLKNKNSNQHLQNENTFERCLSAFEAALQDIDEKEMWKLYVECLISLCQNKISSVALGEEIEIFNYTKQAVNVITRAHKKRKLPINMYEKVVEFLIENDHATKANCLINEICFETKEASLLIMRIKLYLMLMPMDVIKASAATAKKFFYAALDSVSMMAVTEEETFWCLWMEYAIAQNKTGLAKKIVIEYSAGRSAKAVSSMLSLYLKWITATAGIRETHQIFRNTICRMSAPSLKHFHYLIDTCQSLSQHELAKENFDFALTKFGTNNVDLWIKFIAYCHIYKATEAGSVFWRAKRSLEPSLVEEFLSRYTLMSSTTVA